MFHVIFYFKVNLRSTSSAAADPASALARPSARDLERRKENAGWAGPVCPLRVHHVGGSCCGGRDLTKAAFLPTNPSLSTWATAPPPLIILFFFSYFHMCLSHTHTRTHTLHVLDGIFHSAADLLSAALQLDLRLFSAPARLVHRNHSYIKCML